MRLHNSLLPAPTRPTANHPRGNAEIELLLAIPVLLVILFLAGAMFQLGPDRIRNVSDAERVAYEDATASPSPANISTDPGPVIDPINSLAAASDLPDLPNRLHTSNVQKQLNDSFGNLTFKDLTLTNSATFASPPLIYSGWPCFPDQSNVSDWTNQYAIWSVGDTDDPNSIAGSLDLAPGWPP
ncbi:MAG: hypothetical protein ACTHN5_05465 [Phycisphaerae bacterium]